MLKKLYIDNYRSFSDTTIEFGQFNCLIGPNNAGKSNLIDALEFLDIAIFADIDKAVKDKGGFDRIKNYRKNSDTIIIRAEFSAELVGFFGYDLMSSEHIINVQLTVNRKDGINTFIKDIQIDGKLKHLNMQSDLQKAVFPFGGELNAIYTIGRKDTNILFFDIERLVGDFNAKKHTDEFAKKRAKSYSILINQINEQIKTEFGGELKNETKKLLSRMFGDVFGNMQNRFDMSRIFCAHNGLFDSYFFVPSLIRKQRINERALNKDGTSLVNYLEHLKEHSKEAFEKISYSLIGEIEVASGIESTSDGGLPELEIVESMADGTSRHLNIMQASEGTIHFIAIMTALSASQHSMIMIEEPERSLHMRTLSYIVEQCRNNAGQVFITTHSSELLNLLADKEIAFVYRDELGNSRAKRADKIEYFKKLKKIYKNDIAEIIKTGILDNLDDNGETI